MIKATQPGWALRLLTLIRRRTVTTAAALAGAGILILTGTAYLSHPDGNLHVWMLDMGHSNAVLVQTPGGAQMLVDGGHFPSRLLTALGDHLPFNDHTIEALFITQPDEFDTAALTAVLDRYAVGVTITNGQPNQSESWLALQDALAQHEIVVARAGYTLELGDGVRVEVLHPRTPPDLNARIDANALVLRVVYGDVSFLLTGDLSAAGQETLLADGQWPVASVLQLPEHGAARSLAAAFLAAVQSQVAVLESDRANRQGDPNPDTLGLLGDVPLFRTDDGGSIHLWTDGRGLWVGQKA